MMTQKKTIYPKRALSQNYLIDENICRNIVKVFDAGDEDIVLEIGPGRGAITKYLVEKTKHIIAVEIDKDNCDILRADLPSLIVLNENFLKSDLKDIQKKYSPGKKLKIIGNIPYNITSDILFKLIDDRAIIDLGQLMIQEEVARRLTAKPNTKDYGILSVFLQVYTIPKLLFKVSSNCFFPKPKVNSRIIKFDFNNEKENEILDAAFFRRFVRTAFGTRRKTLRNSLNSITGTGSLNIDFDFSRRAESLSPDEFIRLSNSVYTVIRNKRN
jgi:16S rRNA (adenine1518-N6/adenine1519-N6)-dimethyltransferase